MCQLYSMESQTLSLLEKCSSMAELKQIHAHMFKTALLSNPIVITKFLSLAASPISGNLSYAIKVFETISRPNSYMSNSMIRAFADSNEPELALILYQQMLSHSIQHNSHTFPFLLTACSKLSAIEETRQVHAHVVKLAFDSHIYTVNSLLHAYSRSGYVKSARLIFNRIEKPDMVSWNSMIDGYIKSGDIETASELFKCVPEKNAVSFSVMISGHVQAGLDDVALKFFEEMQISGVKPGKIELTNVLSACANLGALDQGRWVHTYIKKNRVDVDQMLGCVLTDMYARCGSMQEALGVFKKIKTRNVALWTALIHGFAIHGHGREALYWFDQMLNEGLKPNSITFTAILTACSYAGLVDEGKSIFRSIEGVYNLKPAVEHYGCIVDLLGRAGLLKEAEDLIRRTPIEPNAVIWGSLLNACRIHGNTELGNKIGRLIINAEPEHGGRYVHLANIHAAAGEWDKAVEVRRSMKEHGASKLPGCSTIFLDGTLHEFFAGDWSHLQIEEIDSAWSNIAERLRLEGYKPETRNTLLDLEDDEKEAALNRHSEKLAVAFGLIRTKPRTTIRIIKNLRVCEDCHKVMKLISKIYDREIVMRDRTRFHVFSQGNCTCGDYW